MKTSMLPPAGADLSRANCGNCRHWELLGKQAIPRVGQCKAAPPTAVFVGRQGDRDVIDSFFPPVVETERCGMHQRGRQREATTAIDVLHELGADTEAADR